MISQVRDKVEKFLKEMIGAEGVRIVVVEKDTVEKDNGGWVAEAEVAVKNQYLASVRPEYNVIEKELYIVKLDANLEVSSYKRKKEIEEEETKEE